MPKTKKAEKKELTVEQAQRLLIHENEKKRLACAKEGLCQRT